MKFLKEEPCVRLVKEKGLSDELCYFLDFLRFLFMIFIVGTVFGAGVYLIRWLI